MKNEATRRIGAVVMVRNQDGEVLMAETHYRKGLQLPGGAVHQGEQIADGAMRELAEETGLRRVIEFHLGVDQIPANPSSGACEGFNFICDGGFASAEEVDALKRQGVPIGARDEIKAFAWVPLSELDDLAEPYMAARVRAAVQIADSGLRQPLLYIGRSATERHAA
ncbi:NUDIX domain-containing protein [Streptomyces sp. FH025]|uniref:NUDIX domain-containing protein n=1 Tax=Streptomyces sp. FH025 TaxID=2815937 RepID=UPI001A9DE6BE|nr:NUDIX hydrolase [Streptomyces sp. FH025]MBO1412998.1 NUDIX hydrolase [Streptomyces sp. FH025]